MIQTICRLILRPASRPTHLLLTFYYKKTRIFSQEVVKENYNLLVYSATRLPTNHKSHDLLQRDIFPITAGNTPVGDLWNMMVFYKVSNKKLEEDKIICPVDTYSRRRGNI